MKAIHQGTKSTKLTTRTILESDSNNEDSDLPLEAPHSHIELSKNHQVAFGVINLH